MFFLSFGCETERKKQVASDSSTLNDFVVFGKYFVSKLLLRQLNLRISVR